jgi:hypothetical protein
MDRERRRRRSAHDDGVFNPAIHCATPDRCSQDDVAAIFGLGYSVAPAEDRRTARHPGAPDAARSSRWDATIGVDPHHRRLPRPAGELSTLQRALSAHRRSGDDRRPGARFAQNRDAPHGRSRCHGSADRERLGVTRSKRRSASSRPICRATATSPRSRSPAWPSTKSGQKSNASPIFSP